MNKILDDNASWVGDPACETQNEEERTLIRRRDDLICVGIVTDAEADYSFDDYALVGLDGKLYLVNASGCSCPSPSETWGVVLGPVSFDEMSLHIDDCKGEKGYGVTRRQHQEFVDLLEAARAMGFK